MLTQIAAKHETNPEENKGVHIEHVEKERNDVRHEELDNIAYTRNRPEDLMEFKRDEIVNQANCESEQALHAEFYSHEGDQQIDVEIGVVCADPVLQPKGKEKDR